MATSDQVRQGAGIECGMFLQDWRSSTEKDRNNMESSYAGARGLVWNFRFIELVTGAGAFP